MKICKDTKKKKGKKGKKPNNKQTNKKQYDGKTQTRIYLTTFNFRNWPQARLTRKKTPYWYNILESVWYPC